MSSRRRNRRTPITRFLGEVVESAKDLADNTLDRVGDAEQDVRRGIVRLVRTDRREDDHPTRDRWSTKRSAGRTNFTRENARGRSDSSQ